MSARNRKNSFDVFCRDVADLLVAARVAYLTIGGLAVIAIGKPRTTADFDIVAVLDAPAVSRILAEARERGFAFDDAVEARRLQETGTLRLRRGAYQLDIIGTSLPFELTALGHARPTRLFGRVIPMPRPEDLLLFKVLAGRDKDMVDAVGIVERHGKDIDRAYVEGVVQELCDEAQDMSAWTRLQRAFASDA